MTAYIEALKKRVKLGKEVFMAPTATVMGEVTLGDHCSVWFGAVLRSDKDKITVGDRTNIQDNAVIHVDPGVPVTIGHEVIIGHSAIVHGSVIGDNTLIGMGATILNNCRIGQFCVIGANALITEGSEIPDFSVVLGSPGKVVKQLNEEQKEAVRQNAEVYVQLAQKYLHG
ncbi:MAG: gamma carbonic anhydrase family protein [Bacteroidia bacterium]